MIDSFSTQTITLDLLAFLSDLIKRKQKSSASRRCRTPPARSESSGHRRQPAPAESGVPRHWPLPSVGSHAEIRHTTLELSDRPDAPSRVVCSSPPFPVPDTPPLRAYCLISNMRNREKTCLERGK